MRRWIYSLFFMILVALARTGESSGLPGVYGVDALRKEIAATVPAGGDVVLFSPADHLHDLFLPLREENGIGSLLLVVPAEEPFTEGNLPGWMAYVSRIAPGADNSFVLRDGAMLGEIRGLKVTVVPVRDWKRVPAKGPAILDLAFLFAMYRDEVRTPFAELPRKFLATLDDRKLDIARLRCWAASRDEVPLAYGYVARLVADMIRDPGPFRDGLPRKWDELRRGEYLAYFSAFEDALPHFERYLKEEPDDPAVLFRVAMMTFVDGDIERGMRFLHRAFKADPHYARGYREAASRFLERKELDAAERIVRAGLILDPASVDLRNGLGLVLLEQAKRILRRNAAEAEKRFSEISSIGLPEESLARLRGEWERLKSGTLPDDGSFRGMPEGHPRF